MTYKIIGCAMKVHNTLGNGFQEVIYQRCLAIELEKAGLSFGREAEQTIFYEGIEVGTRRADFVVEGKVIVELKALINLEDVHHSGTDIKKYPAIAKHLNQYKTALENRAVKQPWFQLQQAQNRDGIWENPKMVYPDIGKESRFTIDFEGIYVDMKGFVFPSDDFCLLSILNSSTVWWFLKKVCAVLGDPDSGGRLQLKRQYVELIPIPKVDVQSRKRLTELSKNCISMQKKNQAPPTLEKEIDVLVYHLYELTYDEVKIIDKDFWLSEEEYETFKVSEK